MSDRANGRRIGRREFVRDSLALVGATTLAGCAPGAAGRPPAGRIDLFVTQFCKTQPSCDFGVLQFNGNTGALVRRLVSKPDNGGMVGPDAIAFGPDGNLYVSSFGTDEVARFDGRTGRSLGAFVRRGSGGVKTPHNFVWGPDGRFYLASRGTSSILRYDAQSGEFIDVFIPRGRGGLNDPTDLVFRPDGMLYVSDYTTDGRPPATDDPNPPGRGGAVRRYHARTGEYAGDFIAPGPQGRPREEGLDGPHAFVFGPDGDLYVACSLSARILRYNGWTGAFRDAFVPTGRGGLASPEGLAFGPDGNLYVTDFDIHSVLRYDGRTGAFIDAFVPTGYGGCVGPGQCTFHPAA
jgi:DNA-binding beta-propeller fold protein YncE